MTSFSLDDWLQPSDAGCRDTVALAYTSREADLSYASCYDVAVKLAGALSGVFSIKKGDRIAILSRNSHAHMILFAAAIRIGAVLVPLNYRLTASELAVVVADCDPAVLFYSDEFRDAAADIGVARVEFHPDAGEAVPAIPGGTAEHLSVRSRCEPEDAAMILYTSGTTGAPRGVIQTHGMLRAMAGAAVERYKLTRHDRALVSMPLHHTAAWNVVTLPLLRVGGRIVLADRFDPAEHLETIERDKITVFPAVPTMLQRIAEHRAFEHARLDSLRCVIAGGAASPQDLISRWIDRGVPVWQNFGMTEAGPGIFSLSPKDALRKPCSVGKPAEHVQVRLVNEAGEDVPNGQPGELLVSGSTVAPGYWHNQARTAAAVRDGWLGTGDCLRRDDEGYFYVAGRRRDMYISGGENVFPAEVESVLARHPLISEVAVVGVPDTRWGEAGAAYVVPRSPAPSAHELHGFMSARIAKYKVPRHFFAVDALPLNEAGKIDRRMLRVDAQRRLSG